MKKIKDYRIIEQISETRNAIVHRVMKEDHSTPVVIKTFKSHLPSTAEIARFKHEYGLIKDITIDGVIRNHEMIMDDGRISLVMEDFKGVSIKHVLKDNKKIPVKVFLAIAVKLADALGRLHAEGVVHLDIKPSNILINHDTMDVKIIDFGISRAITHEDREIYNPDVIEGTLAYMSPEQTGRMNLSVDYRTDIYSLGITFYEMLTGTVPFMSDDPMTIMHSHIAVMPEPPSRIDPDIPVVLSDIILKMTAKNAEGRYQNAFGLAHDLEECAKRLDSSGFIEPFPLAVKDISHSLNLPQRLYGRDREIQALISSFDAMCHETSGDADDEKTLRIRLMLVSGEPGIGKSALIQEIHKPIVARRGYFISGKYEQFRKDTPYSAMIQAFQNMILQILSENTDRIEQWRTRIMTALGENGKLMTDIIPELELIIGRQPEPIELDPVEARNRFNYVMEKFTAVFTRKEHPVVLFLDDLQWIDMASIQLFKIITSSKEIDFLFIIGAFRAGDVDEHHPLADVAKNIKASGISIKNIHLGPITPDDLVALTVDFLKCDEKKAWPLSEIIHAKTGGNPFFVMQFFKTLCDEHYLTLDPKTGWNWDPNVISEMTITDNVVDLLSGKITKLSQDTRDVLKACACIGNRFDLETLASAMDENAERTLTRMAPALAEGFITYADGIYRFQHDRVQEAAYGLATEDERKRLHYTIGTLALGEARKKDRITKKLFYITDQLNLGCDLIKQPDERHNLVSMNLNAGKKAKWSSAYDHALNYFETGIGLLEKDSWEKRYGLTLDFYAEAAEAAYLAGAYGTMDTLIDTALTHTSSAEDRVRVMVPKINALIARDDLNGAIDTSLGLLKLLGFNIPRNPSKLRVAIELAKTKAAFFGKKPEDLAALPPMTSPKILSVIHIIVNTLIPAFLTDSNFLACLVLRAARFAVRYGNSDYHPFFYGMYGVILGAGLMDYKNAMMYSDLGKSLIDASEKRAWESGLLFNHYALTKHWVSPIKDTIEPLLAASRIGVETGAQFHAGMNRFLSDAHMFYISGIEDLPDIDKRMEESHEFIKRLKQRSTITLQAMTWQIIQNIMGKNDDPFMIRGEVIDAEKLLPEWEASNNKTALAVYWYAKQALAMSFGDYAKTVEHSDQLMKYRGEMQGVATQRTSIMYESISRLILYRDVSFFKKIKFRFRVFVNQRIMKKWTSFAPMNSAHMYTMVEAFRALKLRGNQKEGDTLYHKAVDLAKEYDERLMLALFEGLAQNFNTDTLPENRKERDSDTPMATGAKTDDSLSQTSTGGMPTEGGMSSMDISTVVKSSQTLSSEIDLTKLLTNIMRLSMENAGAQLGYLILDHKEGGKGLTIEVSGTPNGIEIFDAVPVNGYEKIASSVVNYVYKTGDSLVINDAGKDERFMNDPYISTHHPKSIISSPIRHKGKNTGILYLENNLTSHAFTRDRIELMQILSTQAAISIENARLFDGMMKAEADLRTMNLELEDRVDQRTRELKEASQQRKEAYDQIMSSIRYAGMIQHSLLPPAEDVKRILPESLFIWEPRDVVGGDLYTCDQVEEGILVSVIDCTGHGVPGAFMTMLAGSAIRRIIREENIYEPADILKRLNTIIRALLQQDKRDGLSDDGLDAGICFYSTNDKKLYFAGAGIPLYVANGNGLTVIKANKQSIGYASSKPDYHFDTHTIDTAGSPQTFYMNSDGCQDQLGGPNNRRFGTTGLKKILLENHREPFDRQKEILVNAFMAHKKDNAQTDDVTLVGFRVTD